MYTPIITPADLDTVVYPEIQNEISRTDNGVKAIEAINAAIQEAKMYLRRYDLVQLFGDAGQNVSATVTDTYRDRLIKNMALWHFIKIANVTIVYDSARNDYKDAIKTLENIQKGLADPDWPLATQAQSVTPSYGGGTIINNPLRNTSGYIQQQQLPD